MESRISGGGGSSSLKAGAGAAKGAARQGEGGGRLLGGSRGAKRRGWNLSPALLGAAIMEVARWTGRRGAPRKAARTCAKRGQCTSGRLCAGRGVRDGAKAGAGEQETRLELDSTAAAISAQPPETQGRKARAKRWRRSTWRMRVVMRGYCARVARVKCGVERTLSPRSIACGGCRRQEVQPAPPRAQGAGRWKRGKRPAP